jgi:hypothetical protein
MGRARIRDDWLAIAAIAYLVANLFHGADHIRQELAGVNVVIAAGGAMLTAAGVAAVIVALRHDPRMPLVATVAASPRRSSWPRVTSRRTGAC